MQQNTNFINKTCITLMYYHINRVYISWFKSHFKILLKIHNFYFLLKSKIQIYVLDKTAQYHYFLNRIVPRKGHDVACGETEHQPVSTFQDSKTITNMEKVTSMQKGVQCHSK